MSPEAIERHLRLPGGIDRTSGKVVPLAQCHAKPSAVIPASELSVEQQRAIVEARWIAGEWSDAIYEVDGLIDRDRALRELNAQTDLGRRLMKTELRSLQMAREDTMLTGGGRD